MQDINSILKFVSYKTGCDNVALDSDIEEDLGCSADDFHELIADYAKIFKVDMSSYLWYFHTVEEGGISSIGGSFFKPPYNKVSRIPITPAMLLDFAQKGKWNLIYPPHEIPKKRYDLLINLIIILLFIVFLLYHYLIK